MYGHVYKISKFGKFDLFARTIIRAGLKCSQGSSNTNNEPDSAVMSSSGY